MTDGTHSRRRDILMAVLGVITCVAITLSATTVWVHQVALNTDRYVAAVTRVATNPAVVEEVSGRLADQVVDQFEIPRLVQPLIRNWIQEQIATFMGTDVFLDAWAAANRAAHATLLRVLRSDSILQGSDGDLSISVLPVILVGLQRLQEVGLLPDDLDLPNPSDPNAADAVREVLAERLGIDLAPDFGEMPLVRLSRLETARQVVRIFDLVAVVSVVVAVALVALTVWLARNRRRALVLLGLGTAVSLLVAMGLVTAISGAVASALTEDGAGNTVSALLDALVSNLVLVLGVVLVIAIGAAAAAWFVGRRSTPMALAPAGGAPPTSVEPAPASDVAQTAKPAPRPKTAPATKKVPPETDEPAPPAKPAKRARKTPS